MYCESDEWKSLAKFSSSIGKPPKIVVRLSRRKSTQVTAIPKFGNLKDCCSCSCSCWLQPSPYTLPRKFCNKSCHDCKHLELPFSTNSKLLSLSIGQPPSLFFDLTLPVFNKPVIALNVSISYKCSTLRCNSEKKSEKRTFSIATIELLYNSYKSCTAL